MSKRILLLGATGMVGNQALHQLIDNPEVKEVISIGRRVTGVSHEKLTEIIHSDFKDFSPIEDQLKETDACIYCIGVYQGQVSKESFFEITCDYQKAFMDSLEKVNPNIHFVLMSAQGADITEKSRTTFAAAKGKAENLLKATQFPKKHILRPGYIQPTGSIKSGGLAYTFMRPLGNLLMAISAKSIGIKDRDLAKALVTLSLQPLALSKTYENREIYEVI